MKTAYIVVTPEDATAPRGSNTDCPVARALKRRFNGISATVGYKTAAVYGTGTSPMVDLSPNLTRAIQSYVQHDLPFETGRYAVYPR